MWDNIKSLFEIILIIFKEHLRNRINRIYFNSQIYTILSKLILLMIKQDYVVDKEGLGVEN